VNFYRRGTLRRTKKESSEREGPLFRVKFLAVVEKKGISGMPAGRMIPLGSAAGKQGTKKTFSAAPETKQGPKGRVALKHRRPREPSTKQAIVQGEVHDFLYSQFPTCKKAAFSEHLPNHGKTPEKLRARA